MVIYDPSNQSTIAIDFRETAPLMATPNMFDGDPQASTFVSIHLHIIVAKS